MRRPLLALPVLGLLTAGAPVAHATPDYHYAGGCGLTAANDITPGALAGGRVTWSGAVHIVAVATDETLGLPAFASLTVDCDLYVNGYLHGPVGSAAGNVVALNASRVVFTAGPWDVISLCETVVVQSDTHVTCYDLETTPVVPEPVIRVVEGQLAPVDPVLCRVLAAAYPGVPGTVDVGRHGDVDVFGDNVYDCPPYAPPYTGNPDLPEQTVRIGWHS